MPKPEFLHLRYHHLEFIRYLGTVSALDKPVGYQMDEDSLGAKKAVLQELADHLTDWQDVPIVWVQGADYVCALCDYVDARLGACGSYRRTDRDRTVPPEDLRRQADGEVQRAYDVDTVRTLGDLLRLERGAVLRKA